MSRFTSDRTKQEQDQHGRIIAHFDFDAFYVACERELNPNILLGVPVAVSQYNPYGSLQERKPNEVAERLVVRPGRIIINNQNSDTNGSLIAVSYEARAAGVRRNDRGHEATKKCPDLHIVQVPVKHGKADLSMYRDASQRVLEVLVAAIKSYTSSSAAEKLKVEKASVDEIYIDLTAAVEELVELVLRERDQNPRDVSETRARGKDLENNSNNQKQTDLLETDRLKSWNDILSSGASLCTTVAGVETMSHAALASASLSKDEIRRGSKFQVLDSSSSSIQFLDDGSSMWWDRDLRHNWTDMEIRLACGAALASFARNAVSERFCVKINELGSEKEGTIFTLSAGISTNKTLAKLASGLKKPNRQTLINPLDCDAIRKLFHPLKLGRIRGLGGKFGEKISQKLGVTTLGDIAKLPLADIERVFPPLPDDHSRTAKFLFLISRGICTEEVSDRTKPKSISCGKTFRNQLSIDPSDDAALRKWLGELCNELSERVSADRKKNCRFPSLLIVSAAMSDKSSHMSRSVKAPRSCDKFTNVAIQQVQKIAATSEGGRITGMHITATSFVDIADGSMSIIAALGRGRNQIGSCQHRALSMTPDSSRVAKKASAGRRLDSFWTNATTGEGVDRDITRRGLAANVDTKDPNNNAAVALDNGSLDIWDSVQAFTLSPQRIVSGASVISSTSAEASKKNEDNCSPVACQRSDLPRFDCATPLGHRKRGRQDITCFESMGRFLVKGVPSTQKKKKKLLSEDKMRDCKPNPSRTFFDKRGQTDNSECSAVRRYQNLTLEMIDHDVLDELPREVRDALMDELKGNRTSERTRRIDGYFSK